MKIPACVETKIRALADNGSTLNCYIYDTSVMRKKIDQLTRIMPHGVGIFYAMKANPHPAFLAAAHEGGVKGIEIASLGEAHKAVAAGFKGSQLIYTGPGKSPEELRWSVENDIRTIHIESLFEAYRLDSICAELDHVQDVLLRINADFDIHEAQTTFSGGSKKFGVDEEKLDAVLPRILALPYLNFRGLHVYAASGVLNVADLKLIDKYDFSGRMFFLELGRYLAADSGWFCTEIIDIKESRGKKQVICAGGINHFRRPAALAINHPLAIVRMDRPQLFDEQESVRTESVYFGGPLCTGADKLANNVQVAAADIGDIAVFGYAGAYGLSMSNIEFLSHVRPDEVLVSPAGS